MLKTDDEGRISFKLRRTSFLRDSNFNYDNDVVDVWWYRYSREKKKPVALGELVVIL